MVHAGRGTNSQNEQLPTGFHHHKIMTFLCPLLLLLLATTARPLSAKELNCFRCKQRVQHRIFVDDPKNHGCHHDDPGTLCLSPGTWVTVIHRRMTPDPCPSHFVEQLPQPLCHVCWLVCSLQQSGTCLIYVLIVLSARHLHLFLFRQSLQGSCYHM